MFLVNILCSKLIADTFDSPGDEFHPKTVDEEAAGSPDGKSPSKVSWLNRGQTQLLYCEMVSSCVSLIAFDSWKIAYA